MYRAISGHDRDRLGCDDVADEIEESPWDGVMADNDIFDDYYGLKPPIEGGRTLGEIRNAIDRLIDGAGSRLNKMGRILVPNIAESRRDPGRWARHSAYGGDSRRSGWRTVRTSTSIRMPASLELARSSDRIFA